MIDALGNPQSLLLLGGTSEIGLAIVERLARGRRLDRVVLASRASTGRQDAEHRVKETGVGRVECLHLEAADTASHEAVIAAAGAAGDLDVVVVAIGVLPDNEAALADPAKAVDAALVNYVGAMSLTLHAANHLKAQGHGVIVVLSSVAAERPRRANFVYGSTKAGLDSVAVGLSESLRGTGVSVLVVRPGFVRTRMTQGLTPAPLSTNPDVVAEAVARNLTGGSRIIWVPGQLRGVMFVLRHLPQRLFRRLPQ